MKTPIKNWQGRVLGFIEDKPNGDKIVKDFYGRILGQYHKSTDTTRDFYGRVVARGDQSSMLLGNEHSRNS